MVPVPMSGLLLPCAPGLLLVRSRRLLPDIRNDTRIAERLVSGDQATADLQHGCDDELVGGITGQRLGQQTGPAGDGVGDRQYRQLR
jgi:hypothetical protein